VDRPIAQASSYNLINGTFSCENDYTMNTILKGELNFQGLYVEVWAPLTCSILVSRGELRALITERLRGDSLDDTHRHVRDGHGTSKRRIL
jgi:hypothetical protein